MKRMCLAIVLVSLSLGPVLAAETCQGKALGADGKPLAGAALKSFITKCAKPDFPAARPDGLRLEVDQDHPRAGAVEAIRRLFEGGMKVKEIAVDACEPKAVDKNGKPLVGAAKTSFLKKCQSDA